MGAAWGRDADDDNNNGNAWLGVYSQSVTTELRELIAWRRDGLLTDVEFVDAKRRLLEVA